MRLIKVVEKLRAEGTKITIKHRKDGGIRITSINGVKYKGVEGNAMARAMSGEQLSTQQLAQRKGNWYQVYSKKGTVTSKKGSSRNVAAGDVKINLDTKKRLRSNKVQGIELSSDVQKELRKTQRAWNKAELFSKGRGRITKRLIQRKFRSKLKAGKTQEEAEEEVLKELREARLYAQGYANEENAQNLIDRVKRLKLQRDITNDEINLLDRIVTHLENLKKQQKIKEEDIDIVTRILYNDTMMTREKIEAIAKYFKIS